MLIGLRSRLTAPGRIAPCCDLAMLSSGCGAGNMSGEKIWLFDTTLRDGGQTRGVDFSRADKLAIAHALDDIGIDYIEAGWPGANPTDDAFFAKPPKMKNAKLVSFGMTRRGGRIT